MTDFSQNLKDFILSGGASDTGFSYCEDGPENLKNGISIVVRLSESIVKEIADQPTHTYFSHYRAVNSLIDNILLRTGLFLQNNGYHYITVAASQSINGFQGRYSHKKAACLAGLGTIGKNALFLHKNYGSLVRLGTLFTDCDLDGSSIIPNSGCRNCDICVKACPALAIKGNEFSPDADLIDFAACSNFMKNKFQLIGRGAVCGICMRVCPKNFNSLK